MDKIRELERQVEELKERIAKLENHDDWIGRLVMVSNSDGDGEWWDEWQGPVELYDIDHDDDYSPYIALGRRFKKCELYEGPMPINMIPWDGNYIPVDENANVLVKKKNGDIEFNKAWHFYWNSDTDVEVGVDSYAVIEVY